MLKRISTNIDTEMDVEKEQECFELWWESEFTRHKLGRIQTLGGDISSEYRDHRVEYAFKAWLARADKETAKGLTDKWAEKEIENEN